ncbi:MAG: hypothetical protein ABSC53_05315 [Bacteroidota bacterium]
MTDSTIAIKDVENWIRNEFLFKKYHQVFSKRKLGMQSGGEFECDAVSEDGKIEPPYPPFLKGGRKGGYQNYD